MAALQFALEAALNFRVSIAIFMEENGKMLLFWTDFADEKLLILIKRMGGLMTSNKEDADIKICERKTDSRVIHGDFLPVDYIVSCVKKNRRVNATNYRKSVGVMDLENKKKDKSEIQVIGTKKKKKSQNCEDFSLEDQFETPSFPLDGWKRMPNKNYCRKDQLQNVMKSGLIEDSSNTFDKNSCINSEKNLDIEKAGYVKNNSGSKSACKEKSSKNDTPSGACTATVNVLNNKLKSGASNLEPTDKGGNDQHKFRSNLESASKTKYNNLQFERLLGRNERETCTKTAERLTQFSPGQAHGAHIKTKSSKTSRDVHSRRLDNEVADHIVRKKGFDSEDELREQATFDKSKNCEQNNKTSPRLQVYVSKSQSSATADISKAPTPREHRESETSHLMQDHLAESQGFTPTDTSQQVSTPDDDSELLDSRILGLAKKDKSAGKSTYHLPQESEADDFSEGVANSRTKAEGKRKASMNLVQKQTKPKRTFLDLASFGFDNPNDMTFSEMKHVVVKLMERANISLDPTTYNQDSKCGPKDMNQFINRLRKKNNSLDSSFDFYTAG